jgi:hypothetical protein
MARLGGRCGQSDRIAWAGKLGWPKIQGEKKINLKLIS